MTELEDLRQRYEVSCRMNYMQRRKRQEAYDEIRRLQDRVAELNRIRDLLESRVSDLEARVGRDDIDRTCRAWQGWDEFVETCSECGGDMPSDSLYCPNCGRKVVR